MAQKSGIFWVTWASAHAADSKSIEDLDDTFKGNVKEFIAALEAAGATVSVTNTLRSADRAYLFHWCWMISLGKAKASDAPARDGVDIQWDHGAEEQSKKGAKDMVDHFGLAVPPASTNAPALDSRHIEGKAIDMNITWTGTMKIKKKGAKDGEEISIDYMADVNKNTKLHEVGESYGVKKLTTDAPHWSTDGR